MTVYPYISWPGRESFNICVSKYHNGQSVLPHKHDFVELVIIGGGSCSHTYNGINVPLIRGDAFVVVPHEQHAYEVPEETVIYNCLFYPEALGDTWKRLKDIGGIFDFIMVEPYYRHEEGRQEILHLNPVECDYTEGLLNGMIKEQNSQMTSADLVLNSTLVLLLVFLGRIWDNQFAGRIQEMEGKRSLLKDAIAYIESHLEENLSVSALAARTYLSPNYFRQKFKDYTGLSPLQYINRMRIIKAMEYLQAGDHTIGEISEKVGVRDPNYFARIFRQTTGCCPSKYIKS